jgi:hypothetical protein
MSQDPKVSPSALRDLIWTEWLTAQFNVRYYAVLRQRYSRRDRVARGVLALTSSSTIAGLAFWSTFPALWQVFVAATAVVAVVTPILGYSKLLGDLGDGYGRWAQAQTGFEGLWERLQVAQPVEFSEFEKVKAGMSAAVQAEVDIPVDKTLADQCYEDVIKGVAHLTGKGHGTV